MDARCAAATAGARDLAGDPATDYDPLTDGHVAGEVRIPSFDES
jgi:hypothetical protein